MAQVAYLTADSSPRSRRRRDYHPHAAAVAGWLRGRVHVGGRDDL